ncbi:hypothetical protein DAEQUDRAFT_814735 [Daedalea quercina L-15889]|uniref:GTP binding protein 2 n=1 Tax=Daedalea quercina L-15889 TaxID=1314783 RepID=A0A165LT09_9APHY|nr:hypothetical protein DAEQUDRAFT_814735 [Daedalea quercina L-15889]
MFGERPSGSPRVPSPWDPFLPSPPSGCSAESLKHITDGVPKLVPEVEEGNIEYKLKLTHISPARFARLVTQLKWRLLEGSGQAYYELGVADSGALIGLSRADLEASLETLDRMAGEIGASVIVVKEIDVPPAMYALAEEASRYIDPKTGEWAGRMHARRRRGPYMGIDDDAATTETTETETELETTDVDDDDTGTSPFTPADSGSLHTSPLLGLPLPTSFAHRLTTHPNRPSAQSSPYIAPFDDDLAMFSMEPEPPHLDIDTIEDATPILAASPPSFVVDLEIASVYKPRPLKRPASLAAHGGPMALHGRAGRRAKYEKKEASKEKKVHPWQTGGMVPAARKGSAAEARAGPDARTIIPNREETKAALRRQARERKRDEKRQILLTASGLTPSLDLNDTSAPASPLVKKDDSPVLLGHSVTKVDEASTTGSQLVAVDTVTGDLVSGLVSLHVSVDQRKPANDDTSIAVPATSAENSNPTNELPVVPPTATALHTGEPRLIVEALVVRKQSLEETFVDFGNFQLV